ncbi:hypothetical protein QJQ45_021873 [Haematococcus lacustris]|nr:hypothetical protein QJQ45_021873 [Haematococcus lacustris]
MWACKALILAFLACAANGARAASAGDDATVSVWPGPFSPIPSGKPILPIFTGSSIQLSTPAINASVLCDVGNATAPTISEWLGLVKPKPTTANSTDVVRCDKPRPAPATPGVSASRRLLQSAASSKKAKHGFVVLSASATWMLQDGDAVHLTSRISHKICRSAPELGGLVVCDLWKPSNLTTFTLHLADASGNSATSGPFVPGPMNLAINLRDNSTGLYCEPDASAPGTPLACSLQAPSSWDASQPPMLQLETSNTAVQWRFPPAQASVKTRKVIAASASGSRPVPGTARSHHCLVISLAISHNSSTAVQTMWACKALVLAFLACAANGARAASAGDDATVSVWPGPFSPIPSGKPILPIFTGSSIQLSTPAINASVLCDVGNATAPTISEWLGLVKPKPTTANSTDVVRCDKPRPAPATPGVSASRRLLQSAASSKKAKHGFVVLSASATWMLQDGDAVHLTSRISHKICRSAPELGGLVVCDLWKPSNLTTFTLHLADASGNSATSGPFVPGPMNLAINLRDNSTGLYCEPDASAPGTPLACSLQAPSSWDASQPPMLQLETSSEWWAVGSV